MKATCVIAIAGILAAAPGWAEVERRPLAGQAFVAQVDIDASPSKVFRLLSDIQRLSSLMGYRYHGPAGKRMDRGASVPLTLWQDQGSLTLVRSEEDVELRYVWDPDDADYVCVQRWLLASSGRGTRLTLELSHTDMSGQTEESLEREKVKYGDALARVKASLEGKPIPRATQSPSP